MGLTRLFNWLSDYFAAPSFPNPPDLSYMEPHGLQKHPKAKELSKEIKKSSKKWKWFETAAKMEETIYKAKREYQEKISNLEIDATLKNLLSAYLLFNIYLIIVYRLKKGKWYGCTWVMMAARSSLVDTLLIIRDIATLEDPDFPEQDLINIKRILEESLEMIDKNMHLYGINIATELIRKVEGALAKRK